MAENGLNLQTFFQSANYEIPMFQRDYSWEKDQIEEFWEDVWNTYDENVKSYFFGPVVLIDKNNGDPLKIVDGQQRITTINIFMILIRDILKFRGNDELATRIEFNLKQFGISLTSETPKLKLNQNNNLYFLENIFPYNDPEIKKNLTLPGLKTNQLLLKAYKQLFNNLKVKNIFNVDKSLAEFVMKILETFELMPIKVDSDQKAYRIFATLNQRGKNLADSDLIKNYLLETSDSSNVNANNERWMSITQELNNSKIDEFIRHSWMAKYGFVAKQKLYENITKKIGNNSDVSEFLKLLDEECAVFKELRSPTTAFWGSDTNVNYIKVLFDTLKNESAQSLFLSAHRKWGNYDDFKALARICMDLHFRGKTIGPKTPSDMVTTFVKAAGIVRDGIKRDPKGDFEPATLSDVKDAVKELDITNTDFEMRILNGTFSGPIARYILHEINSHKLTTRPITTLTNEATLEHILVQTMSPAWEQSGWTAALHDKYYERIGNLTLVHGITNSEMGNKTFEEKKVIYARQKDIHITYELRNEPKWDADAIESRSEDFSGDVSEIWLSLID
jgi:hypothetical protein